MDVPPETALDSMLKAGMPQWNARAVTELYGIFAAGKAAGTADTVEWITGRALISFDQFARDHAAAFS
jgi:hypothetical protein